MTARLRWALVAVLAFGAAPPGAGAAAPRDLLPNLVPLASAGFLLAGPGTAYRNSAGEVVWGCHPSEVANDTPSPRRCLRFETRAANLGAGPFELHYRADEIATTRGVTQRVYASDGTYRDTAAGTYVLDPTHAHFHLTDFAVASLWRSTAGGARVGPAPLRTGRKAGFCLQDVYPYTSAAPAAVYTGPTSCYPTRVSGGTLAQVNGVSAGWVDVYDLSIPHQYIEVSGVPDGYYLLQISLDPAHRIRQSTRADDTVWQRIRLCGDRVDIVGRTSGCSGGPVPTPPAFAGPHLVERLNFCAVRP
jgi:hypothetical protein